MISCQDLPTTHRALVQLERHQPLVVERERPTLQPTPGSAILRVESTAVVSYQRDIYNGTRSYPYPTPFVPGFYAIGRVVAVGPDAVALAPGQLVYFDGFIRARDDPSVAILSGLSDVGEPKAQKLMAGEWRDSTFAEFVKAPLENCFPLDETKLCGSPDTDGLGYTQDQLAWIGMPLVGYGGLRSIGLQAGETVIIAPATGGFGGGAALVAVAMGARVIAMGRNKETLRRLQELSPRIHTAEISGDHEAEMKELSRFGPADALLDLSPPAAAQSTMLRSGIKSLRKGGRVSLMGGIFGDMALPLFDFVFKDLAMKGQWMYGPEIVRDFIKLMESGVMSFEPVKVAGKFGLEQWKGAFDVAAGMRFDEVTVLKP